MPSTPVPSTPLSPYPLRPRRVPAPGLAAGASELHHVRPRRLWVASWLRSSQRRGVSVSRYPHDGSVDLGISFRRLDAGPPARGRVAILMVAVRVVAIDRRHQRLELDEVVGLPAEFVGDQRRLRPERSADRNADAPAVQGFGCPP